MDYRYASAGNRILQIDEQNFSCYSFSSRVPSGDYNRIKSYLNECDFDEVNKSFYPYLSQISVQSTHTVPVSLMESHYNKIQSSFSSFSNDSVLPMAVRYIDDNGTYYIERPPFKINVDYKDTRASYSGRSTQNLQIWIPWTIVSIPKSFSRDYDPTYVTIHYSHKQLETTKDTYLNPFLPNSHSSGSLCWSSSFTNLLRSNSDSNKTNSVFNYSYWYSMIINDYFGGGWNTDLQSSALMMITPRSLHFGYRLTGVEGMDDDKFKQNYPLYHKYVYMQDYPDLYESVCKKIINSFGYPAKKARDIISLSKPNRLRRSHGLSDYVRFFAFMSQLSLNETLSFYEEIQNIGRKQDSRSKEYLMTNFANIVKQSQSDGFSSVDNSIYSSFLLPVNSAAASDPEFYASSFSNIKKYNFNVAIINPKTENHISTLNSCYYGLDFFVLLNTLKWNCYDFANLIITHIKAMKDNPDLSDHTFIILDLENKTVQFYTNKAYKEFLSDLSEKMYQDTSKLIDYLEEKYVAKKKTSKNVFSAHSYYYDQIKALAKNKNSFSNIYNY